MRRYMRNKNFISESFYKKICEKNAKRENKIFILFLILNLCMFPLSVENISTYFKERGMEKTAQVSNAEEYENIKKSNEEAKSRENLSNIKLWLENLQNENIISADISDTDGEISVANLDDVNNINLDEKIKVRSLRSENELYKLEVEIK